MNNTATELPQNVNNLQIGYNANPNEAVTHGTEVIANAFEA